MNCQVFGEVTQGLEHLCEVSRIGKIYDGDTRTLKADVVVEACGVL